MNQQKPDNAEVYERFSNLDNRDLSYQDLREYDLIGATLKGAKLMEANLSGAILKLAECSKSPLNLSSISSQMRSPKKIIKGDRNSEFR